MEIKTLDVQGFEAAIAGMRNPLKSYGKADSAEHDGTWDMGDNDLDLARRLIKAGPEHRKFLRMIWIWADITAPRFWWSEFHRPPGEPGGLGLNPSPGFDLESSLGGTTM